MADTLLFRVENGVGWIVLNRPEARNAMNAEMRQAYLDALARCAEDAEIRGVVLTGTGKGFCTGDDLPAADAERLGLVNKVVAAAELEATAREWAERLARGPTFALGLSKRLLNRSLDADLATCFSEEAFTQALVAQSDDMREGIRAFMEKRPPAFRGR